MKQFTVYEVQDDSVWRKFMYEVEAEDEEHAMQLIHDGYVDAEDWGTYGDSELGDSGTSFKSFEDAANKLG
jgi:hypothetical protein